MARTSLAELLPDEMTELRSRHLMDFFIEVKKPWIVGKTPGADRRIGEIAGGHFEGRKLKGTILTSGSDWQTVRGDGVWMINVRMLLETDDGALIATTYQGMRHGPQEILDALARGESVSPDSYYMRVAPVFETASPEYDWLNRLVSVAQGHRIPGGAVYRVFEIL
jgi:hypothetical protein